MTLGCRAVRWPAFKIHLGLAAAILFHVACERPTPSAHLHQAEDILDPMGDNCSLPALVRLVNQNTHEFRMNLHARLLPVDGGARDASIYYPDGDGAGYWVRSDLGAKFHRFSFPPPPGINGFLRPGTWHGVGLDPNAAPLPEGMPVAYYTAGDMITWLNEPVGAVPNRLSESFTRWFQWYVLATLQRWTVESEPDQAVVIGNLKLWLESVLRPRREFVACGGTGGGIEGLVGVLYDPDTRVAVQNEAWWGNVWIPGAPPGQAKAATAVFRGVPDVVTLPPDYENLYRYRDIEKPNAVLPFAATQDPFYSNDVSVNASACTRLNECPALRDYPDYAAGPLLDGPPIGSEEIVFVGDSSARRTPQTLTNDDGVAAVTDGDHCSLSGTDGFIYNGIGMGSVCAPPATTQACRDAGYGPLSFKFPADGPSPASCTLIHNCVFDSTDPDPRIDVNANPAEWIRPPRWWCYVPKIRIPHAVRSKFPYGAWIIARAISWCVDPPTHYRQASTCGQVPVD